MILATRIVLLVVCALFFLATLGANTEERGYLHLLGAAVAAVLLLASFKIV